MIYLDGNSLTLKQFQDVVFNQEKVSLSPSSLPLIKKSRAIVEKAQSSEGKIYSINTGFGILSKIKIPPHQIKELQQNFVRSHCSSSGALHLSTEVRAMLLLRANVLAKGFSGVRAEVIDLLIEFLNQDILPEIPSKGSVGCSGDLSPLAHIALCLIGEGFVTFKNNRRSTAEVLKEVGLTPLTLEAKEGLSLTNGTQQMTSLGLLQLLLIERLVEQADQICATSLEGIQGSRGPFQPWLHELRPLEGQKVSAQKLYDALEASEVLKSHEHCDRVQDPYSFRCAPQVHGAVRDLIQFAKKTLCTEMNSVTDNPIVNPHTEQIVSNGNFHGEPIAFALDILAMAVSELGNISERRITKLINPVFSELPSFLVKNEGLHSGFMIAQYLAASLVVENRILSHPASTDSVPTNNDKEDHNSMGPISAHKLKTVVENTATILGIEALTACQALEFRNPLKPGRGPQKVYEKVRKHVPALEEDRVLSYDIEKIKMLMLEGYFQ